MINRNGKRSRLLLTMLLIGLHGCTAQVAPWERGNLAKPHMALDPEPAISVLREHVQVSKESTYGGGSNSGGGCGCN